MKLVERTKEDTSVDPDKEAGASSGDSGSVSYEKRPRLAQAFSSLRYRDYRLLLTSGAAVSIGMWMEQVAQGWLVYELTDSAFYLGLVGFCRAIPMLFFSLIGGVLADRVPRRNILLFTRTGIAALALAIALLITAQLINVWWVLGIAILTGVFQAINQPARQAIVYEMVGGDDLMNAVALNSAVNNSARIIGPALAGISIAVVGIEGAFYLKAIAFALSVFPLLMIRPAVIPSNGKHPSVLGHLSEGLSYVRRDQTVLTLILLALIPMVFAMPYVNLMPVFADTVLNIGPEGLGLLMSFTGAGAVIGAFCLAFSGSARRRGLLMLGAALMLGVFLAAFALSQWLPLSLLMMAGIGAMQTTYMATNNTLLQTYVRDDVRGRVMGIYHLDRGLVPMGSLFAGTMASLFGTPVAVFTMGSTVIVLAVIVLFTVPHMRRVD